MRIERFEQMLTDPVSALPIIRTAVRESLLDIKMTDESSGTSYSLDRDWVERGTEDWEHLKVFRFTENGVEFLFAPYSVAAYAFGSHSVLVSHDY
jgi:hypothetical protein